MTTAQKIGITIGLALLIPVGSTYATEPLEIGVKLSENQRYESHIESVRAETIARLLVEKQERLKALQCDISVNGHQPPVWFAKAIEGRECKTKQLLSRLAFFESTWRDNVCDYLTGAHCGRYQFGKAAIQECKNNGKYGTPEDCALYHIKVNYRRFEAITNHFSYFREMTK